MDVKSVDLLSEAGESADSANEHVDPFDVTLTIPIEEGKPSPPPTSATQSTLPVPDVVSVTAIPMPINAVPNPLSGLDSQPGARVPCVLSKKAAATSAE